MQSAAARGALARIGAADVRAAARLVQDGEVVSLVRPLTSPHPPAGRPALAWRSRVHNSLRALPDGHFAVINDDVVEFALQGSSHWDALAHFGAIDGAAGIFHGGGGLEEADELRGAGRLGIDAFAPGIVARGVLIDAVGPGRERLPDDARVTAADIRRFLGTAGVALGRGDVACVFTGAELVVDEMDSLPPAMAGLDTSAAELLAEAGIAALACDNVAVDALPVGDYPVHRRLLRDLGIPLGEMWALRALTERCRADGRWDFMLVSVPLNIPGAYGSPANAVAIR